MIIRKGGLIPDDNGIEKSRSVFLVEIKTLPHLGMCMCLGNAGVHRGQRHWIPQELEVVVPCSVGSGKGTLILCKMGSVVSAVLVN